MDEEKKAPPGMPPELVQVVGSLLHGAWWQSPMSRHLKVTRRTLLRWVAGKMPPPRNLADELLKLCEKRRQALNVVILTLHKYKQQRLDFDQSED